MRRTRLHGILASLVVAAGGLPASADAQEAVVTLERALSAAMSANPSISASRQALEAATWSIDTARAGFLPQVVLAAGYRRATANSAASPALPSQYSSVLAHSSWDSYDNLSASLTVSQTVWDFGRTLGGYDAAKANRDASASDVATARNSIRTQVVQAYYGVLASQELLAAANETRRQMEKHLDVARAGYDAGVRQRIDVTRATSDLAQAELSIVAATNGLRTARVGLLTLMGDGRTGEFVVQRPAEPESVEVASVEDAVREAIANRPEYAALDSRIRASDGQVSVAQSAWFPAIGVNGSWSYQGYQFTDLPFNWAVGVSLSWNALSGVAAYPATRAAEANLRALEESKRGLVLSLRQEVESAVLAYRQARESLTPAKAVRASAQETLDLAEGRYAAGAGSIVEVTDAQAVLTQAKTQLIQAEFNVVVARALLLKALGRSGEAEGE
jgi:outer membrane protein